MIVTTTGRCFNIARCVPRCLCRRRVYGRPGLHFPLCGQLIRQIKRFSFSQMPAVVEAMKLQTSIWDVLTWMVAALFLLAGVVGVYFWYKPLIEKNRRYRQEILALDAKIEAEERLERKYRDQTWSLQSDPRTVERLVREKLGYARTNETVVRFEPGNKR